MDQDEETLLIAKDALAKAEEAKRIASEDLVAARAQARLVVWAAAIVVIAAFAWILSVALNKS